jgi:diguanylate cyclase (GGDEF)-like protein
METMVPRVNALMEQIEPWIVLQGWRRYGVALLLFLMLLLVAAIVYETGGIKYVYSHTMYIPIILAGIFFLTPGGILAGVVAGVLLGPYMPLVVASGEMQSTFNWVYRLAGFAVIGGMVGFATSLLQRQLGYMRWLARHDSVTGLPNDVALEQSLHERLEDSEEAHPFSLVAFSLDGLDNLRDTFGYVAMACVLRECRDALCKALPQGVSLFHYHPERFAIIIEEPEESRRVVRLVLQCLRRPFRYDGFSIHLIPYVGVSRFPEHGSGAGELVQKADTAIWQARKQRIEHLDFQREFDHASRENLMLMGMLSEALEEEQLRLHYQPKVDLQSRRAIGAEALLRWHHPERGMIPPGYFIPLCEQTDLINPVTAWVMEHAVARLAEWKAQELHPLLAINISTRNLVDPMFYRQVRQMVDRYDIDPCMLEFEITETAIMQHPEESIGLLGRLRDMRLVLSIDDFGTGHSSLACLNRLPVEAIKIDQTFIRQAAGDSGVCNIIRAAADVGHALGMKVIAEGIEDSETCSLVADLGCDIGQGYHIGRPMPEQDILDWFRESPWPLANVPTAA